MEVFKEHRQQKILDLLREKRALTTADLRQLLGVSAMTVHRDLSDLAEAGLVERVHGGVLLAGARGSGSVCAHCGKETNPRTAFIIHLKNGQALQACCAHCGLSLIDLHPEVVSGLTADFLHGTMTNVKTATYLLHADLSVCCTPSALSFASREEAARLQAGFGGKVLELSEALHELRQEMQLSPHHGGQHGSG